MPSLRSFLLWTHLVGLALAVGCSTVKLTLLVRCRADATFAPVYATVSRPITRLIIAGLTLLTLSGVGWLAIGYPLTDRLVMKLVMVGAIWVLGPVIDNVVEPKFRRLAPAAGEAASPAFIRAGRQYLMLEMVATGLFYVIITMWVLL